jgi:hypothetical protein
MYGFNVPMEKHRELARLMVKDVESVLGTA